MSAAERSKLIWALADAVEGAKEEFALLETLDNGKPYRAALTQDVTESVAKLRYYAGWPTKMMGSTYDLTGGTSHAFTLREPVGVAGLIVPWNFPLLTAVNKMGAALAAGCTVVIKPADETPLTMLRLGQLIEKVGFPKGVVNIVTGTGAVAGAALVDHPAVNKISFTGSTEVGRIILRSSASNFKRVTLELGGKSPCIIFPDADLESAIASAAGSAFSNTGQTCTAGTRLYAHESVFEEVIAGVAAYASKLTIGPGISPDTDLGPLVSEKQKDRVSRYIDGALSEGAHASYVGQNQHADGYFMPPHILTDISTSMTAYREEIFGPVLCAMSFSGENIDALVSEANNTEYGLSAYIHTRDLSLAHRMARRIKAGTVRVNGGSANTAFPFGGYKQSGWGREGGQEGVDAFTELKTVVMKI